MALTSMRIQYLLPLLKLYVKSQNILLCKIYRAHCSEIHFQQKNPKCKAPYLKNFNNTANSCVSIKKIPLFYHLLKCS